MDVKRVCVLGAESTGKSTLASTLAERFETLWNPEYGRPYTQIGRPADEPWASWEFTHIAHMHCWYEDFLAGLAHRVLFSDTDAFTTSVFHEVYLGAPATAFPELVQRGTTCLSSAASTSPGATTESGCSRSSAAGCMSAISSARVRAAPRGCLSRGRRTLASRWSRPRSIGCFKQSGSAPSGGARP